MTQIQWAKDFVSILIEAGARDFVLCPGARNAPLIEILDTVDGVRVYTHFDERGAAFFALGLCKAKKSPVAVVTTSGTAVSETLSAVIEAHYTFHPLWIVSADRPSRYRQSGAPQSIEQVGLFGNYVRQCFDLTHPKQIRRQDLMEGGPLHFNICFEEPLLDEVVENWQAPKSVQTEQIQVDVDSIAYNIKRPLILACDLGASHQDSISSMIYSWLIRNLERVVFEVTAQSQVPTQAIGASLSHLSDQFLVQLVKQKHFDCIIRVGGVPTSRLWRDLESQFADLPVFVFAQTQFSGLARKVNAQQSLMSLTSLDSIFEELSDTVKTQVKEQQLLQAKALEKFPKSEQTFFSNMSKWIQERDFVYIGNSLPIRYSNWFSQGLNKAGEVSANRGANGIDGQVATFLGQSIEDFCNWCVIGDLTALYDLNSLAIANQLSPRKLRLVVINNNGGRIFEKFSAKKIYLNSHHLNFEKWAEMFKWDYIRLTDFKSNLPESNRLIIEICPDTTQSQEFLKFVEGQKP